MKFTEEKLEQVFIELLEEQGYTHVIGDDIARNPDQVIIEEDLKCFLLTKYENERLTEYEAVQIIRQLKSYAASDLYESNKSIMKLISNGFILKRENRSQKDLYIQLIDYSGLIDFRNPKAQQLPTISAENPVQPFGGDKNIYKFVNQLEIVGFERRIPCILSYFIHTGAVTSKALNKSRCFVVISPQWPVEPAGW